MAIILQCRGAWPAIGIASLMNVCPPSRALINSQSTSLFSISRMVSADLSHALQGFRRVLSKRLDAGSRPGRGGFRG